MLFRVHHAHHHSEFVGLRQCPSVLSPHLGRTLTRGRVERRRNRGSSHGPVLDRLRLMASTPAVPLAPGIFRIPTVGKDLVNSFALVQDDGSVTLVDTGLKKAPARIVAGMAAIGKHPHDVTRILLTHVHPDHAGGAAEMSRRTGAPVLVHGDDHQWARSGRLTSSNDPSTRLGRLFARTGTSTIEPFEPGPPLQ